MRYHNLYYCLKGHGLELTDNQLLDIVFCYEKDKIQQADLLRYEFDLEFVKKEVEVFMNVCDLRTKNRGRKLVRARHFYTFISITETNIPYVNFGFFMGGFDHSTITHAMKTVESIYSVDEDYRGELNNLLEYIEKSSINISKTKLRLSKIKLK